VYSYTPTTSGTYTFESTNASGDAVGRLTVTENGSERELVRNDDGGRANGNSRNFSFSYNLTEGTTYRFHAWWYSSSASGTMVCQLSRSANAQAITADGLPHTVRLTEPGQYAYFSFVPPSSGTYVFESVNTSGDPYGYLYCVTNENGNEMWQVLASNDDGAGSLNFRISYVFTAGVTYYFGVRFWGSSATGEITVQLTGENPRDKVLTPPTASNPVVEDYEEITTLGERKYFQFTPTVSGTYVFESTNTSNDPVGELYESDRSTRITSNDDGGNGRNFRLVYDLIAGTTYYYAVRFFGSSTIGRIDVRLTLELDDIIIPIVLNASEVALKGYTTASVSVPGTTANSAVSNGVGYFSFTPTVSGTYVYESTNSSGDTVGALYDSVGGTQLASNDDGGTGSNFRLSYSLTADTTYIYTARWYGSGSGDISVRVRRDWSELATVMQAGSTETARIRQRGQVVYFAFTPSTTQEYSFESSNNVSDDSSIFDPLVTLFDEDFNSLQSNDDGGEGRNFYITSTLTGGTTYYYGVKRYGDSSTGSATVRLSGAVPASNTTTIDAAAVESGSWTGTANITTAGDYAYFVFTPRSAGTYIFESTNSDGDPHGHFYENGLGSTSTADNDDGGNGLNFRLVQTLEAGRTYGFAARWHWSSSTGTIYVRMTKEAPDDVISLDAAAVEQNNFTTATATISTGGRRAYFSFTPQTSGSYIFESTNTSGDTYGFFYDTQSPDDNTTPADRNDDGGNGLNFRLTKTLTAGTTYYYGAKFYSSSTTGNIEVKMSKGNPVVNPTGVTVELASSSIYVGNNTTATARVTPDNATDKSVTWSSSNTSVATIVGGRITGVAEGTATITARTVNDITGSATITVEPTPPTRHEFHTDFEYNFLNTGSSFGYGPNYKIPQVRFEQVGYTPRQAASIYNASSRETKNAYWGGSCFGFSSSSVLFYKDILQEENYDPNVHVPH
ncbi:MAG: Ig-like domain-containing protein, partial [Oscillibacter sp.]|nr:Ig-like domain-containing protein [Oscillibacter sp.]